MYYPEQKLTIKGVPIPGHFSVIINKPLIYSTILVPQANWPDAFIRRKNSARDIRIWAIRKPMAMA